MRGKLPSELNRAFMYGITPADAGKTETYFQHFARRQDHPRGCGENCHIFVTFAIIKGSPPRMRGKRVDVALAVADGGITPADAGKTRVKHYVAFSAADHPRGCGENFTGLFWLGFNVGSPPRMRGKLAGSMFKITL